MVALDVTGPPRIVLALAFVTFVPGWALLGQSRVTQGLSRVALAVAASLTICTATAVGMAWLEPWRPFALFYGLGAASLLGLGWRAVRPPRIAATPVELEEVPPVLEVVPAQEAPPAPDVAPAPDVIPSRAQQRRLAVWPESLRLSQVAVRVVFLPRPPFAPSELTNFFAAVHERHPFADFHRHSDEGAVMETKGSQRLEILRDGVEYSETGPVDFDRARGNAVDLLREVGTRLDIGMFANPTCHLRATVGSDAEGGFPSALLARAAGVDLRHTSLLGGSGPVELGVRLTGRSDDPRHTWQAMLEPEGPNGQVSLDVTTAYLASTDSPDAVGGYLDRAHHFLTDSVVRFVEALVDPPPDEH